MSTLSNRIDIANAPGYWAIEIRLGEAGQGRRYLCHAENDRAAVNMAGRLMGSAVEARGFDSLWIQEALLERERASLPGMGAHQVVSSSAEWDGLVAAHNASEAADPLRS
ncbi:hypothetical protein [Phenylobacterium sp.]|uniref:hypothetical protein n=1 Tax=Phenylobacterium sp. TaxID=1871053 RepID=UPI002896E31F|nr:hypothetical protein [Phenylobacterium sp.]